MTLVGIDPGGTFTDFVLGQGGELRVHKVLSTPAVIDGEPRLTMDGRIAGLLGLSLKQTALGIVRLANEHMARALRIGSKTT